MMIDKKFLSENKANWEKLNEVFAAAVDLSATAQPAFLRGACDGDENLRSEVEAMLQASRQSREKGFLKKDAFRIGARILAGSDNETLTEGKRIGNYRIIREIGRGGMGAVYLAEREDFQQRVALKIVKRGMDSDDIVRRFHRERQVLASLNHPNIAHLLDGGSTANDLPFFVMEYVEGLPITEFCDRQRLTIEERLGLFRKVCAAVAYAHQNLVVHRDIKPSNILVTKDGEPKLLDFGISKLLAADASENTATEVRLMTPEYASPEQVRGEMITTVSDIYSLGVLLYELLSGHRPFKLKNRPSAEILKIISEEEPSAPSTAALTAEEIVKGDTKEILSPQTIAESRAQNPPERLCRRLSGDLDNIVLMSLRKEPALRYGSVEQFSEDLRRHLAGLPVIARPATFGYHFSKFVRRNRVPVAFSSIALLALLAGLSVALWQAHVARQERTRAEQRFNEVRKLANTLLDDFDTEVANLPGSYKARGKLVRISSEYLNALAQDAKDPALLKELAEAYLRLGGHVFQLNSQRPEAQDYVRRAIEIARRLAHEAPDDLERKEFLAKCLIQYEEYFGQFDRDERLQIISEIVRLREEIVAAAPDDIQALGKLSEIYVSRATILRSFRRHAEAMESVRLAIETRRRQINLLNKPELTPDESDSLFWANLWVGIMQANDFEDWQSATHVFRQTVEIGRTAAAKFPEHQTSQTNLHMAHAWLGKALSATGDYRGSLEHYQIALGLIKDVALRYNRFSRPQEARYMLKIAGVKLKLGQPAEALEMVREILAIRREATQTDNASPNVKNTHAFIFFEAGKLYAETGKFDEALAAYREAETSWRASMEISSSRLAIRGSLAELYLNYGDLYADCSSGTFEIRQKDPARLRQARDWYEKSVATYVQLQDESGIGKVPQENLRLAGEKAAICAVKLNGKI